MIEAGDRKIISELFSLRLLPVSAFRYPGAANELAAPGSCLLGNRGLGINSLSGILSSWAIDFYSSSSIPPHEENRRYFEIGSIPDRERYIQIDLPFAGGNSISAIGQRDKQGCYTLALFNSFRMAIPILSSV
jgi:hypothetical protein